MKSNTNQGVEQKVLDQMIEIYKPNGYDWMGTPITSSNKLTYHHIVKEKDGGEVSISNGALLTKSSHRLLHMLESRNMDLYEEWQWLFYAINISGVHPLKPYQEMISELRKRTKEVIYNEEIDNQEDKVIYIDDVKLVLKR